MEAGVFSLRLIFGTDGGKVVPSIFMLIQSGNRS